MATPDTPNIARIRKLLNVTEAAGAARNEAAVARHLAERLLAASGLTEDDVRHEAGVDPVQAATAAAAAVAREYGVALTSSWQRLAMMAVGYVTGCTAIAYATRHGHRKITRRIVWIGTPTQRGTAHVLYGWLLTQINRLARTAGKSIPADRRRRFLHAYRVGVADQVAGMAQRLAAAHTQTIRATAALMRQDAIQQAIARLVPEGTRKTRSTLVDAVGLAAGRLDGATITLQPRVGPAGDDRVCDPARLLPE